MTSNTSIVTAAQHYTPDPEAYVQFQREIYASLRKPKYSTKPHEWEAAARNAIPLANFLYVFGSASSESTYAANRSAFQRYRLRPSMLVQATRRNMSTQLFGKTYKSPLLIAPIGVQEIVHPYAEEATARAAHAAQVPMILSTAATRSIEQVAKANADGDRWYQLYWPKPQAVEFTASLLNRAKDNGFSVLVVTLDTFQIGWRPNDLDESYLPFIWGQGCQVGFSDPVFQRLWEKEQAQDTRSTGQKLAELWQVLRRPGSLYGAARVLSHASIIPKALFFTSLVTSGNYRDWDDLQELRKLWSGPIVLKVRLRFSMMACGLLIILRVYRRWKTPTAPSRTAWTASSCLITAAASSTVPLHLSTRWLRLERTRRSRSPG